MSEEKICPKCQSNLIYPLGNLMVCTQCFHEWNPEEEVSELEAASLGKRILDSNGNELQNGDSVILIKDLPVKGAPKPLKAGTKVKNIRLVEGEHNISCKVEGFGAMGLKSELVRKA